MQTLEPILANLPIFRELKPEYLALITGCASNVRFEAGAFVGRQGDPADAFWVLRQGRVALEIHAPGRGALTISTIGENEVLGWSWLLPPYHWHFGAYAVEPTTLISLDAVCVRGKCEHDPVFGFEIMRRFAQVMASRLEATHLQLMNVYEHRR